MSLLDNLARGVSKGRALRTRVASALGMGSAASRKPLGAEQRQALDDLLTDPQVLIEISSKCNFACDYCSSSFKARKKVDMSRELFEHVVRQVPALTQKNLRLHIDGEPTLHPHFHEMASFANGLGMGIGLATNGSLLTPKWLDLDMVLVITVSTSPEELATRNRKLDFDRYIADIEQYTRQWARGDSRQKLMVQLIHNHEGLDAGQADEQWEDFKEGFIDRTELREHCVPDADRPLVFRKRSGEMVVLIKYGIAAGGLYPIAGKAVNNGTVESGFCDSPWKRLAVLADGRVSYCCEDLSGGTAYTNPEDIWEQSLRSIWLKHPRILEVRSAFARNHIVDPICKTCLASVHACHREVAHNA